MYGEAMRNSTTQVLKLASKTNDGIYSPSCLQHGVSDDNHDSWLPYHFQDLVGDWYFELNNINTTYYRSIEACPSSSEGLPCNKDQGNCQVHDSPHPTPSPSPLPSVKCIHALTNDCLSVIEDGGDCETCVRNHSSDLSGSGCTSGEEHTVCNMAPCISALYQYGCLSTNVDGVINAESNQKMKRMHLRSTETTANSCDECALQHRAELQKLKCTVFIAQKICEYL